MHARRIFLCFRGGGGGGLSIKVIGALEAWLITDFEHKYTIILVNNNFLKYKGRLEYAKKVKSANAAGTITL